MNRESGDFVVRTRDEVIFELIPINFQRCQEYYVEQNIIRKASRQTEQRGYQYFVHEREQAL